MDSLPWSIVAVLDAEPPVGCSSVVFSSAIIVISQYGSCSHITQESSVAPSAVSVLKTTLITGDLIPTVYALVSLYIITTVSPDTVIDAAYVGEE